MKIKRFSIYVVAIVFIIILQQWMGKRLEMARLGVSQSSPSGCANNLKLIDSAKNAWALQNNKSSNDTPTWRDLTPYYKGTNLVFCPAGGVIRIGRMNELPACSIGGPRHSY